MQATCISWSSDPESVLVMDADPESLFQRVQHGDQSARDELFAIVYDELRNIAHRRLGRRSDRCTLNTTAVVDEAYIKLREANPSWNDREHFLRFAGAAMRAIVIDHVRSKGRLKRCAPGRRLELDVVVDGLEHRATASLVDLDVALERLEGKDPNMVRLIEMRFFAGSTLEEAASTLGITTRTAIRWWNTGRAWLKMELERE